MLNINSIVYKLPIEVNSTKLLHELDNLVLPYLDKDVKHDLKNIKLAGVAVTGLKHTPLDNWYNTKYNSTMNRMVDLDTGQFLYKNYEKFTLGFDGPWRNNVEARYDDNVSDRSFTHWHPALLDSEIFNLKTRIATYLQIPEQLRCRASFIQGYKKLNFHSDPHTPWRVHVTLKSGANTRWLFRTLDSDNIIEWTQPKNSVWLIRTGNVQHSIEVGQDDVRWQLFYHVWQSQLGSDYYQYLPL